MIEEFVIRTITPLTDSPEIPSRTKTVMLPSSLRCGVGVAVGGGGVVRDVHELNPNENPSRIAALMTHQTLPEAAPDRLTLLPPLKPFHHDGWHLPLKQVDGCSTGFVPYLLNAGKDSHAPFCVGCSDRTSLRFSTRPVIVLVINSFLQPKSFAASPSVAAPTESK